MPGSEDLRKRISGGDDGELTDLPHSHPYSIIFPSTPSCPVIYTTKTLATTELIAPLGKWPATGMVGRYGVPTMEDIPNIARLVHDHPTYFLGDCDPFDLLVFASLRQHISISYLGVSDSIVSAFGVDVRESITIALLESELRAMSLLQEVWPEYSTFVGPNCAQMLADNRKLELEALVSFRTRPAIDLFTLLC